MFATEPIKMGSLVYTTTAQTVRFRDSSTFMSFLEILPRDLACDIFLWAYVYICGDKREPMICG